MENEIVRHTNQALTIWNDKAAIKKQFGANLTDVEFDFFVSLGAALSLNPFTREIWAVKYGKADAQIFIGRDGYRRKAQELEVYERHFSAPIYENDKFIIKNGIPEHESAEYKNRGALIAAYACVYTKGDVLRFWQRVELSEYNLKQSNWNSKPQTMICKVAEAQVLRGAFQGTFAGTYDESENWIDTKVEVMESKALPKKPLGKTAASRAIASIENGEKSIDAALSDLRDSYIVTPENEKKIRTPQTKYLQTIIDSVKSTADLEIVYQDLKGTGFNVDGLDIILLEMYNDKPTTLTK